MLKRFFIVCLAILVFAGMSAQLVAHATAMSSAPPGVPCDMMDMDHASAVPANDMPYKGMIPLCADSIGCAVVVDLPPRPQVAPVEVRWTSILWAAAGLSLTGLTVEPEVTPPIFVV
jgi:hypothetical protein